SMLTPGAAGALMMLIANSVCRVFPEVEFRYAALALSFAIGLLVFKAIAIGLGEKAFYWVLNSLIIFATGVVASNIGAKLESSKRTEGTPVAFVTGWMIREAGAEEKTAPNAGAGTSGPKGAQKMKELEQGGGQKRDTGGWPGAGGDAPPPQPAATAQQ